MFLKTSTLTIAPETLQVSGEDAVYVKFSNNERYRLLSVYKDKKSDNVIIVLLADLLRLGGFLKMPKAQFEQDFALEMQAVPA